MEKRAGLCAGWELVFHLYITATDRIYVDEVKYKS
jgi:hypothetical protein